MFIAAGWFVVEERNGGKRLLTRTRAQTVLSENSCSRAKHLPASRGETRRKLGSVTQCGHRSDRAVGEHSRMLDGNEPPDLPKLIFSFQCCNTSALAMRAEAT